MPFFTTQLQRDGMAFSCPRARSEPVANVYDVWA